jgi:photosynthetic reaction center cytochrome c subunit
MSAYLPRKVYRAALLLLGTTFLLAGCQRNEFVQHGFRGTGMVNVYAPKAVEAQIELNQIPAVDPNDPPDPDTPMVTTVMKNVQVLKDLNVLEFARLMQSLAAWVAPVEGCAFCHNPENLSSDEKYTKVVARRMLIMTRQINTEWKKHVVGTGVTCWTCHRGQAVPSGDWFANADKPYGSNFIGDLAGQNQAGIPATGYAALPNDALSIFLNADTPIRVQGTHPLAGTNRNSIKQAEFTYSLMNYMTQSLGVNCTYCHNSRSFGAWNISSPQRATAWYGIRMVRAINKDHLNPIASLLPPNRLGPQGDGPKVGCETCHKGSYKPLFGVSMLGDFPELGGVLVRDATGAGKPAN